MWRVFFNCLECEVVTSPETNISILKDGLNIAVDESCLPLKIFLGHVNYLKDKTDYIFLPRIASFNKREVLCTKFMGLYDNVNNSIRGLKLLEYNIDPLFNKKERYEFVKIGRKLGKNLFSTLSAYKKAKTAQEKFENNLISKQEIEIKKRSDNLKIMIVSHPYVARDGLVGDPVTKFLKKEGISTFFADLVSSKEALASSEEVSRDMYWLYNREFLGAVNLYKKYLDGIIYLVAFPCGPDALAVDLSQKKFADIPSLNLTVDELQGEAGLLTRLESFVDILKMKDRS